jgi:hypothetical protein
MSVYAERDRIGHYKHPVNVGGGEDGKLVAITQVVKISSNNV